MKKLVLILSLFVLGCDKSNSPEQPNTPQPSETYTMSENLKPLSPECRKFRLVSANVILGAEDANNNNFSKSMIYLCIASLYYDMDAFTINSMIENMSDKQYIAVQNKMYSSCSDYLSEHGDSGLSELVKQIPKIKSFDEKYSKICDKNK